eukprot:3276417-Alexandrium_andersonii.AAC.1
MQALGIATKRATRVEAWPLASVTQTQTSGMGQDRRATALQGRGSQLPTLGVEKNGSRSAGHGIKRHTHTRAMHADKPEPHRGLRVSTTAAHGVCCASNGKGRPRYPPRPELQHPPT